MVATCSASPATETGKTTDTMTTRSLLVRGMLVGLAAGLLALAFGSIFGEPPIGHAIDFEAARAQTAGAAAEPELVSRLVQRTAGLATAVFVYGVAFGGLFGLAFAVAYRRIGAFSPRATAGLLALAGFVTVELATFLKYPANPPAIGEPETIGRRTTLYFLMMVVSVLGAVLAVRIGQQTRSRWGTWNATLVGGGVYLLVITAAYLTMPAVNEVPGDFSATVLWQFRVASVGTQLVLWATFGLLFGALTERSLRPAKAARRVPTAGVTPG